jgi:hypothetical protein
MVADLGERRQELPSLWPEPAPLSLSFTMGGVIHVLLVLAVIAVLVRIILGRRVA